MVFHKDIQREVAQEILKRARSSFEPIADDQWRVVLSRDRLGALAAEDGVKWIQQGPIPFLPLNDQVRSAIQVDPVQGFTNTGGNVTYSGLDGKGITVAVFDSGIDPNHDDFWGHDAMGNRTATRLLLTQPTGGGHGTHVAGIIAGSGYQSDKARLTGTTNGGTPFQWRGMAPNATLIAAGGSSYSSGFSQAINQFQAEVSNHSYVQTCSGYDATANDVDSILRGDGSFNSTAIPARSMVWAAGNNGSFSQYCGTLGYFSILSPAKNPIVVASTNADDTTPASRSFFSSLGPTPDGRLKPDVSAPGCKISAAVVSTELATDGYTGMCGTSMAAPASTGTVALLLQQWHKAYGASDPLPSSMKVALVQGASDLVDTTNPRGWPNNPDTGAPLQYFAGPDYATGYGLINAVASRDIIAQRRIIEDRADVPGEVDRYEVKVPAGATRLRVTLAWDDEPGSIITAVTASKLVNDLDLEVQGPGISPVVLPWILPGLQRGATEPDPIQVTDVQPAHHGVDRLNNVEQVEATNPVQGTWSVRVKAFALPLGHSQLYSLVADFGLDTPPIKNPPPHRGPDPCINIEWEPVRGFGLVLDLPARFRCGVVAFPPICRYIFDCPPCGPFGFCPPFEILFPGVPDYMRVQVFDENGKRLSSQEVRRGVARLTFTPEPGARPYLVFLSDRRKGRQEKIRIPMSLDTRNSQRK